MFLSSHPTTKRNWKNSYDERRNLFDSIFFFLLMNYMFSRTIAKFLKKTQLLVYLAQKYGVLVLSRIFNWNTDLISFDY